MKIRLLFTKNSYISSFKQLKFENESGIKVVSPFQCKLNGQDGNSQDCFVKMQEFYSPNYNINLSDENERELGGSSFSLDKECGIIDDLGMTVKYNADKRKGLGTVLHLTHIIEMLENDIDSIDIYSVKDAVYFHAKMGFKANIKNMTNMECALFGISQSEESQLSLYKNYADKLKSVLNKNYKKENTSFFARQKALLSQENISETYSENELEFLKNGNDFVNDYIRSVLEKGLHKTDKAPFTMGITMELKKEDVLKNKDFYNSLFEKYKIDYKI